MDTDANLSDLLCYIWIQKNSFNIFSDKMKKIKALLCLILLSSFIATADVYDDISTALKTGDSRLLSSYFDSSIELTISDKENSYSKAQAEQIVKDFFSKNPPKSYSILHKGSSPDGTKYVIGTLSTSNGKNFRTSYFIKSVSGKTVLQELRIELE
jgi:hypothetical protein